MKTSPLHTVSLFVCVVLFLSGCTGHPTISGSVKFDDGKPLTVGMVTFQAPTYVTSCPLDSSGNYSVQAPAGDYVVYIPMATQKDETFVPPANEPDAVRHINLIDNKFGSPETSPLKCTVAGSQTYDILVTTPEK